jgi:hypothetical protein
MMLLDHEDRRVVLSAVMRKAVESAGLVSNPNISVAKKNIMVNRLNHSMSRLQAMYRISNNDFSNIEADIQILKSYDHIMPLACLEDYTGLLSAEARDEEGYIMVLDTLLNDFMPILERAFDLSEMMFKGYAPIIDSDRVEYIRVRDLMTRLKKECVEDAPDVPYITARRYIDHVISQCNLMLRIGAYKNVSSDECAHIVDEHYTCDANAFESIFMDRMNESERNLYKMHSELSEDRVVIVVAKCINNSLISS